MHDNFTVPFAGLALQFLARTLAKAVVQALLGLGTGHRCHIIDLTSWPLDGKRKKSYQFCIFEDNQHNS